MRRGRLSRTRPYHLWCTRRDLRLPIRRQDRQLRKDHQLNLLALGWDLYRFHHRRVRCRWDRRYQYLPCCNTRCPRAHKRRFPPYYKRFLRARKRRLRDRRRRHRFLPGHSHRFQPFLQAHKRHRTQPYPDRFPNPRYRTSRARKSHNCHTRQIRRSPTRHLPSRSPLVRKSRSRLFLLHLRRRIRALRLRRLCRRILGWRLRPLRRRCACSRLLRLILVSDLGSREG